MSSKDFGILALELYFPKYYVAQSDLEIADGCSGKYTKGLGQISMGFCSIEEDINSICLTVLNNLIDRTKLDLNRVGFLEVGSETLIDKSKATKTVLMNLFESCGNRDIEGIDTKNACFGGTAALFHALNWLESSCWDGRLAIVIAADIAVYGDKNARPTGGAGAVAILLGPNAPLVVDPGLRAIYMRHCYDFYKPNLSSEYPIVDGQLSMQSYREALEACYELYKTKLINKGFKCTTISSSRTIGNRTGDSKTLSHPIDFVCFHTPFCRLVQKALGWLIYNDVCTVHKHSQINKISKTNGHMENDSNHCTEDELDPNLVEGFKAYLDNKSLTTNKDFDSKCLAISENIFKQKVEPGLMFARYVGNVYTASLYACIASLLLNVPEDQLRGRRILLYSYGSGLASAMFSLVVHPTRSLVDVLGVPSVSTLTSNWDQNSTPIHQRLFEERKKVEVAQFEAFLEERQLFHNTAPFKPEHRPDGLFPGSYYLANIDNRFRRTYERMPK